jgi:hypothetical protein
MGEFINLFEEGKKYRWATPICYNLKRTITKRGKQTTKLNLAICYAIIKTLGWKHTNKIIIKTDGKCFILSLSDNGNGYALTAPDNRGGVLHLTVYGDIFLPEGKQHISEYKTNGSGLAFAIELPEIKVPAEA